MFDAYMLLHLILLVEWFQFKSQNGQNALKKEFENGFEIKEKKEKKIRE